MSQSETIQYLKSAIEHAPQNPGQLAPNLIGWKTPDDVYVCAKCAGRIMARGCRLPSESEPIWTLASGVDVSEFKPHGRECCTCEPKEPSQS